MTPHLMLLCRVLDNSSEVEHACERHMQRDRFGGVKTVLVIPPLIIAATAHATLWRPHDRVTATAFTAGSSSSADLRSLLHNFHPELSYVRDSLRTLKTFSWLTEKQTYLHIPEDKGIKNCKLIKTALLYYFSYPCCKS